MFKNGVGDSFDVVLLRKEQIVSRGNAKSLAFSLEMYTRKGMG